MILGNIVVQTVGCMFFFARAYSRAAIIKAWEIEDYVLTSAWVRLKRSTTRCKHPLILKQVFCTGYSVCQYGQIDNGAGRHAIATSMENPQAPITSQKYAYAAQILLLPALGLSKLSICLTYLRLFYSDKRERYMIQALVVLLVLLIISFDFDVAFQCRPVRVYWTEGRPDAKCSTDLAGFFVSGCLNIFVDFTLMAIVLPRVLKLQLHRRQRWALICIVLLGSLAIVAGIARMVRVGTTIHSPDFEPSWDSYDVSIWTATEVYVCLICASAPGMKPIVVKILPKLLGSSLQSRTRTTGQASIGLELRPNWKRTTIGSTTTNRRLGQSALVTAGGPYTQVEGGVDARSLNHRSDGRSIASDSEGESSQSGHIFKESEIVIETHATRG